MKYPRSAGVQLLSILRARGVCPERNIHSWEHEKRKCFTVLPTKYIEYFAPRRYIFPSTTKLWGSTGVQVPYNPGPVHQKKQPSYIPRGEKGQQKDSIAWMCCRLHFWDVHVVVHSEIPRRFGIPNEFTGERINVHKRKGGGKIVRCPDLLDILNVSPSNVFSDISHGVPTVCTIYYNW